MAIPDPFWERIAPRFFEQPIADTDGYAETLARTRAHLRARDHVLEVGCGTGGTAVILARSVTHWMATDASRAMLRFARGRLANGRGPRNIDLGVAEVSRMTMRRRYDAVCAFNLLHLVLDLDEALAAMKSVTAPGGRIITKTPCLDEWGWGMRVFLPVLRGLRIAPRVERFDHRQLEAAFARQQLEVVESRSVGRDRGNRFLVARAPA